MKDTQLRQDLFVPLGVGTHHAGEAPHTVGQPPDLGVDQASGQRVPGGVGSQRGIGQPGAHPVVQPAVELGKAGGHARDTIVAAGRGVAFGR